VGAFFLSSQAAAEGEVAAAAAAVEDLAAEQEEEKGPQWRTSSSCSQQSHRHKHNQRWRATCRSSVTQKIQTLAETPRLRCWIPSRRTRQVHMGEEMRRWRNSIESCRRAMPIDNA
jgi:hypothetical protein